MKKQLKVYAIWIMLDSKYLLSASNDMVLWDLESKTTVYIYEISEELGIKSIVYLKDELFVSQGLNIKLWDLKYTKCLKTIEFLKIKI